MTKEQGKQIANGFLSAAIAFKSPEDTQASAIKLLKQSAGFRLTQTREVEYSGTNTRVLLRSARAGYVTSHTALCEIAADLTSRGAKLPLPLQDYVVHDAPLFKRRRGRPDGPDWERHAAIAATVLVLKDLHGFTMTRNRASLSADSACSIVTELLSERDAQARRPGHRFNLSEAAVEKIATKYLDLGILLYFEGGVHPHILGRSPGSAGAAVDV